MMTNYALNEASYLQSRVDDQMPIYCWLANGIRLVGVIQAHDAEVIFIRCLERDDTQGTMMVMKQQITSIVTVSAAAMYRGNEFLMAERKQNKSNAKRKTFNSI